ncbi:spondin domain-containing protein [Marinicella meishanensis]|uniref:spondin domain-containing protein n=1 Tax=Marinicella meishanensis TaxID=2873263 RepID=UPI001CBB6E1A|nr:spondin domain-containing protein [Marinicella sp. NBU2979]
MKKCWSSLIMLLAWPLTWAQVEPAYVATYRVTFESDWSANTHPVDFPADPHYSGLIGASHGAETHLWSMGELASPGIQLMAETGSKSILSNEVAALIQSGMAEFLLSGPGMGDSPGSVNMVFDVSQAHPRVSLVSMIAPSPDWFVGVDGLSMREAGQWLDRIEVDLRAYDAGTDSGTRYTSSNSATAPPAAIQAINSSPFDVNPVLGRFVFELLDTAGAFPWSGAHSGLYFDPNNSGDGVTLIVSEGETRNFVLATWYTYRDGQQMWLAGSADFEPGDTAVEVNMLRTTGANFGIDFNAADVTAINWGNLTLSVPACGVIDMAYEGVENPTEVGTTQYRQLAGIEALRCE